VRFTLGEIVRSMSDNYDFVAVLARFRLNKPSFQRPKLHRCVSEWAICSLVF
jgi:hypothetical protein